MYSRRTLLLNTATHAQPIHRISTQKPSGTGANPKKPKWMDYREPVDKDRTNDGSAISLDVNQGNAMPSNALPPSREQTGLDRTRGI